MYINHSPIIKVNNLTTAYGDNVIHDDISFEVKRGEILVIVGGSGCGKSTLLQHMIGLRQPKSGQIFYDDKDLVTAQDDERDSILRRFGVLFQSGALFGSMTLAENIDIVLSEYTNLTKPLRDAIIELRLSSVNLIGNENKLPAELSGGMKKRAGLARAMALDPEILFFDEPSAGLDPVSSVELDDLILKVRETMGTTIVIVTHELQSIEKIADRAIMLDKETKKIIANDDPKILKEHSKVPKIKAFFNRESMK